MTEKLDIPQGTLELMILTILAREPLHGYGITQRLLLQVLHSEADNTARVSILLADIVLAPLLFIGPALLFVDLAARVGTTRESRKAARRALEDAPPPAR